MVRKASEEPTFSLSFKEYVVIYWVKGDEIGFNGCRKLSKWREWTMPKS